jgi:tetratricopeptide (TPR) repeat protein
MMRFFIVYAFLSVALTSAPAAAQYLVIGESAASSCYRSAAFERSDLEALADCDTALEREVLRRTIRAATHVNRGIIKMRRGALEAALVDFDEAERLHDRFGPALAVNRSSAFIRMGRYHDALVQTDIAIEADADNIAEAWFNRGVALEALDDMRSAYQAYEMALHYHPGWAEALRELDRFTVERAS